MSKLSLFEIASSQITEVDNKLEEDSYHSHDELQHTANSHSNHALKQLQAASYASRNNQFQQPLNSSQLLKQEESSQFAIAEGVNNSSGLTMKSSAMLASYEEELRKYFDICIRNIVVFPEFKKRLASEITNKIKGQIKQGSLQISEATRNLEFQHNSKPKDDLSLKRELQRKREEAIQRIKEIEEERLSVIVGSRKRAQMSKEERKDKKDVLTETQRQKLAQLVKEKRQFQQSLAKKTEQLVEEAKQRKLKDQKDRQQLFLAENEKKKIRILQSLKQLQLRSQERQQILKKSVLRERSYTHKRYEKQWEQQLKLQEQEEKELLQSIHRKFKFSIEQINQHYKKYSLDLKNRESRIKNQQSRVTTQSLPKRQKTIFDQIIEQELHLIKSMNQKQKAKTKEREFKQKVAQYQQLIDKNHKPRVQSSSFFVTPVQRNYSSVSLSKEQRFQKGLQYLAIAKELRKSEQNLQKAQEPKTIAGYNLYKDYLKERQPVKFNILKKQFSQIMKRPKQSYQELQSAKFLAEGIQAKSKRNPDSKLYKSMKNKLLLLDSLYQ